MKGEAARFPNQIVVQRAEHSYILYERGEKINLSEEIGHEPSADRRIEKIVDWIIERSNALNQSESTLLSSKQLIILLRLEKDGEARRSDFDDAELEVLYTRRFIRDVMSKPGKITITTEGLDALLRPATRSAGGGKTSDEPPPTLPAVAVASLPEAVAPIPPAQEESPNPAPDVEPASVPTSAHEKGASLRQPAANGVLSESALKALQRIADLGGEVETATSNIHHLTIPKLLVENVVEETEVGKLAITPKGIQMLEAMAKQQPTDAVKNTPAAPSEEHPASVSPQNPVVEDAAHTTPTVTERVPATAAPTSQPSPLMVQMFESSPVDDDDRIKAAVFDLLAPHSPALQAAYESYKSLSKAVERVKGV